MTISTLFHYDFSFLPPMTWFVPGTEEALNLLLAGFAGLSILFLLLVVITNHMSHERYRRLTSHVPLVYMVLVYVIAFNLSRSSNTLPTAPLYLFIALVMVLTSFIVLAVGAWLRAERKTGPGVSFADTCKINVWLSFLLSGPLLLPFLFFHVPSFNHQQQLFYVGSPLLMVGLYLLITGLFFRYMATILGLVVPPGKIHPDLKIRFDAACAPILAAADCEIVIARRGLYNAVAQPELRRITVGLSLIEFLNVEQLRAILTHELGHLEDRVCQPRVKLFQQLGALSFLLSVIVNDSGIAYAVFYSGFLVLLTVYFFLIAPKKARLHGEKIADGYVLKTDVRLYAHLQAALSRIYILNGLDKDHCKKHDSDHLDLDERQAAVASGKIKKRQSFTLRLAVILVILIVSAGLTVAYSYFFGN